MGLLGKLWDDTVAGPHPDSGLGKLRKFNTFSPRAAKDNNEETSGRSYGEDSTDNTEGVKVTRSIMIVRPPGYHQAAGSAPTSPAGSTPPASPFSDQEHSDSGENQCQTRMRRRRMRTDQAEALLLLRMSDI